MIPTLHLGAFVFPTHELFIGLGVAVATAVFARQASRRGRMTVEMAWVVLGALFTGAVFAKLSTIWRLASAGDGSLVELWLHGGRSILGGLAGAYVGAVVTKRIVGIRAGTGDLFAPAIAIGMAIGRIGCFLTEQVGTPTSLPWGISVSAEAATRIPSCPACLAGVPMHPSFLYEIAFHVVAFVVLVTIGRRRFAEGSTFKLYLLAYGLFRFFVEFVRGNPTVALGLSGSQLFLLLTVPAVALATVRHVRPAVATTLSKGTA